MWKESTFSVYPALNLYLHTNSDVGYPKLKKGENNEKLYINDDWWRKSTLKAKKFGYNKSASVRTLIEGLNLKENHQMNFIKI